MALAEAETAFAELYDSDLYALLRNYMGRRDLIEVRHQDTGVVTPRRPEYIRWLF